MILRSDGTVNILIVEDDPVDRKALIRALTGSPLGTATIRQAATLAEALALLRENEPDVVLLDLGLPDSSGLEFIAPLAPWMDEIPIVVLTGHNDEEMAILAMHKGVQDYLNKEGVTGPVLSRVIRYAIERKEYERQLRAGEERYREVFENSAVAIMVMDKSLRLVSWNHVTEELLGMDRSDLLGRQGSSLHPPQEWQRLCAFDIHHAGHLETKIIRKTGEMIDIDIFLSPLRGPHGEFTGSMAVAKDITTRKQAETALREREERLNLVISGAELGTWDWDIPTGHITIQRSLARDGRVRARRIGAAHRHVGETAASGRSVAGHVRPGSPSSETRRPRMRPSTGSDTSRADGYGYWIRGGSLIATRTDGRCGHAAPIWTSPNARRSRRV